MAPNSPRVALGPSGFGSKDSKWLIPPHVQITMHDFALVAIPEALACNLKNVGTLRPVMPTQDLRNSLREWCSLTTLLVAIIDNPLVATSYFGGMTALDGFSTDLK